jgi:hypothetical protein
MRRVQTAVRLQVEVLEDRLTPGKITGPSVVAGPGLGSVQILASANGGLNNDNVGGGPHAKDNFVSEDVRFSFVGLIDQEFFVDNTDGVTEYWFEVNVTNNTLVDFQSMQCFLGFGFWTPQFDDFVLSPDGDRLDFDWPDKDPTPFSNKFTGVFHESDRLTFGVGTITAGGGQGSLFFQVDIPDYDELLWPASAQTATGYKFTLRISPSPVPLLMGPSLAKGGFDTRLTGDSYPLGDAFWASYSEGMKWNSTSRNWSLTADGLPSAHEPRTVLPTFDPLGSDPYRGRLLVLGKEVATPSSSQKDAGLKAKLGFDIPNLFLLHALGEVNFSDSAH